MARIEDRVSTIEIGFSDAVKVIGDLRIVAEGLIERSKEHSMCLNKLRSALAAYKSVQCYTPPSRPKDQIEDPLSMLMIRMAAVEDYLRKLSEEKE